MGTPNKISDLTEKEQKVFTLCVIKGCLQYAQDNNKAFEDVLNEDLFPAEASQTFSDMICYNIKLLCEDGYISGDIDFVYDEMEAGEDAFKGISVPFSTFDNISITEKGNAFMLVDDSGAKATDFMKKTKPFLKHIATTALTACIETLVAGITNAVFL